MTVIGTLIQGVAGGKLRASDYNQNFADVKTSVNAAYTLTGALEALVTTAKTSLVNAINELVTSKQPSFSAQQTKTTDYTIVNLEDILADSTSNTVDITLQDSVNYCIIAWGAGTNTVTIKGTVNGVTDYVIKTVNDSITLKRVGTNSWRWY